MTTYYVNPASGNDASDGLSWATAWKTLLNGPTFARLGQTDSDEIRIAKSPDPISIGDVTWTDNSATITFSGCSNLTVDNCESGWTAGIITPTYTTSYYRQGTASVQAVMSATNGKVCYKTITSADYSNHSRITFWVNLGTAANYTAGCPIQIRLCSDTAGDTAVDTFTIPSYYFPANYWIPITLDKGSALGSAIQSVALWTTGAVSNTIRIDNISVTKGSTDTTSLTLTDLIAKDNGNGEYYPITYIDGTTISVTGKTNATAANPVASDKYYCDSGTQTTSSIKRECFSTAISVPATATTSAVGAINYTNIANYPNTKIYVGGVNPSTDTVDGESWFDGVTGYGYGITQTNSQTCSYTVSKIGSVRYYTNFILYEGNNTALTECSSVLSTHVNVSYVNNESSSSAYPTSVNFKWIYHGTAGQNAVQMRAGYSVGAKYASRRSPLQQLTFSIDNARSLSGYMVDFTIWSCIFQSTGTLLVNNGFYSMGSLGVDAYVNNMLVTGGGVLFDMYTAGSAFACNNIDVSNKTGAVTANTSTFYITFIDNRTYPSNLRIYGSTANSTIQCPGVKFYLFAVSYYNFAINRGLIVFDNLLADWGKCKAGNDNLNCSPGHLVFHNVNKVAGDNRVRPIRSNFLAGGLFDAGQSAWFQQQTTETYLGTSAWAYYPGVDNISFYQTLPLGSIVCKAGSLVTVSCRIKAASLTNRGFLSVIGGQAGVPHIVSASNSVTNTWELVSLTFTPTEACVLGVECGVLAADGTTYVYFDDLQVIQE